MRFQTGGKLERTPHSLTKSMTDTPSRHNIIGAYSSQAEEFKSLDKQFDEETLYYLKKFDIDPNQSADSIIKSLSR